MRLHINRIDINYLSKDHLIIRKTLQGQLIILAGICIILTLWYFVFWTRISMGSGEKTFALIFLFSVLIGIYKPLRIIITKESFIFDRISNTVYRNKDINTTFDKIESVEIVHAQSGDDIGTITTYILNLRLIDKSKLTIDENPSKKETNKIAEAISAIINKPITYL